MPAIWIEAAQEALPIGIAEKKGLGHPDTICDEITERISVELSKYYLREFGAIQHHNVDKALLIGGVSEPAYGGGKIVKPMSLIVAGRATTLVRGKPIPVEDIAVETAREWLSRHLPHLDVEKHVQISAQIRSGSPDLVELFQRFGQGETPLANDTSYGAGYYPNTPMENAILRADQLLREEATRREFPFIGQDTKVMGVAEAGNMQFTVAIAIIDRYIADVADYAEQISGVKRHISSALGLPVSAVAINTADDIERASIYLTVTGTSAESGDDGQVGRGNRINGLITPYHPMSLEAASGKNPVSHVGKIYNYFAMDLSRSLVEQKFTDSAEVFLVSRIGHPIDAPQLLHLKVGTLMESKNRIREYAREKLRELPGFWKRIVQV